MSTLELAPMFTFQDIFNARTLPPSVPGAVVDSETDEATLAWEGSASGDYVEGPPEWLYNIESDAKLWSEDPSKRVTETVRVENPDDSEQYVEIERIKSATFTKSGTKEQATMSVDWDAQRSKIAGDRTTIDPSRTTIRPNG